MLNEISSTDPIPNSTPLGNQNQRDVSKKLPFKLVVLFVAIVLLIYSLGREYVLKQKEKNINIATSHNIPTPTFTPTTTATPTVTLSPIKVSSTPTPDFIIDIQGDATCIAKTEEALDLLKNKAPDHYTNVTTYIGLIECADSGSGMFAYENPPRFKVGKAAREGNTIWYAGTIVHEANHSKLYHDYLSAHPSEFVPDNIWTGENAEVQCLDVQYDAMSQMGANQSELNYVKSSKDTKYWEIPYEDRWW